MPKPPSPGQASPPDLNVIHFKFVRSGATYRELRNCYLDLHDQRRTWSREEKNSLRFRLELWLRRPRRNASRRHGHPVMLRFARVYAEYDSNMTGESVNEHEGFIHIEHPVSHPQHLPKELPWLWSAILREWQGLQAHLDDAA